MKTISVGVAVIVIGSVLSLGACSKKSETSPLEQAQQQPVSKELDELLKKAEAGDLDAEVELGEVFATGKGLPKDAVRAADLFRKAAEKGVARAQFRLGQMYANGEGVPKDAVRASDLIKQSAKNGYSKAQTALAAMYAKGETVKRDEVLAYVWSSLALSHGEQDAKQVQDTVTLSTVLRDEAERLKAKWQVGKEIVREKEEAIVPVDSAKSSSPY